MRRLVLLCSVLLLAAAGCGGGGSKSAAPENGVIAASKAFSDAGIPFTTEITSNPYVAGQQVFLPGTLNGGPVEQHVLAFLSGSRILSHTAWDAWVFDSKASANDALKQLPLAKWGAGSATITRVQRSNVIVVAAGFTGGEKSKLDAALAALH